MQVRSKKPSSAMALGEDAQVTIVGATLSNKMFKTVSSFVPVRESHVCACVLCSLLSLACRVLH